MTEQRRRFTAAELQSFRGKTLPDLIGPDTRLLFVGINPGLMTVAMQAHFGRRGNRFYPALHAAGIVDHVIDASQGMKPEDETLLLAKGIGITNLVPVATARADELSRDELTAGALRLAGIVQKVRPRVVAMLGVTAYRTAFAQPKAITGLQPERLAGAELWVLPNPSGLNAHASLTDLGAAYRQAALAAEVVR